MCVSISACVYACMCDVFGVLKVWLRVLLCHCVYVRVCVCASICVCVCVCDVSGVLKVASLLLMC